jgi:CRISPR-associated protein Cst1
MDKSEILLIKKIITIFIIIVSFIIDFIIFKKNICGLNSLMNTEPIRGVIEDFIMYPYGYDDSHGDYRHIDYRISPLVRNIEDNKLYFTYSDYSLSYYTSIQTRMNKNVPLKTIFRGDGSEVKIGDLAFIYIKRKLDINVEIDEKNNSVKLDKLEMKFLHENDNYNIDVFNRIINNQKFDDWIMVLLKRNSNDFKAKMLIELNYKIYNTYKEDNNMNNKQKVAIAVGNEVYKALQKKNERKIESDKHRLLNAMTTNNKEMVLQILTYIHESTGVKISFIFDLIEDYENNKNLVYTFIMAMNPKFEQNNTEAK